MSFQYKSYGSVEGILQVAEIDGFRYYQILDLLGIQNVICNFSPYLLLQSSDFVGKRVYAWGEIISKENGDIISVYATEIEVFPDESELPTIEDITGILREL